MWILPIVQEMCPNKIPVQIDCLLGRGIDGEVYSIVGLPDKVIKLSFLVEDDDTNYYSDLSKALSYIVSIRPRAYVQVYEHGWLVSHGDIVLFFSIMEKLQKISEDEERIFHSILSHEDFGKKKDLSRAKVEELISGMSALDFDPKKVRLFCDNIKAAPLSHHDMHTRNIMKDGMGNFKLIDLDRVTLENEDDKKGN
jgi:hypothetical protein